MVHDHYRYLVTDLHSRILSIQAPLAGEDLMRSVKAALAFSASRARVAAATLAAHATATVTADKGPAMVGGHVCQLARLHLHTRLPGVATVGRGCAVSRSHQPERRCLRGAIAQAAHPVVVAAAARAMSSAAKRAEEGLVVAPKVTPPGVVRRCVGGAWAAALRLHGCWQCASDRRVD